MLRHCYGSIFNNMPAGGDHFHRFIMKWPEQMFFPNDCPSCVPATTCPQSSWDTSTNTVAMLTFMQTLAPSVFWSEQFWYFFTCKVKDNFLDTARNIHYLSLWPPKYKSALGTCRPPPFTSFHLNPQETLVSRSRRTVDESKTSCLLHFHADRLYYKRFKSIEAVVAQVNSSKH